LSPGDSDHKDDKLDGFLIGRLLSFREPLKRLRDEVGTLHLPYHSKRAATLVGDLIGVVSEEVGVTSQDIPDLRTPADKSRRSRSLHYSLEQFVNFVETIVLASKDVPVSFLQLVEMIEAELPEGWRFGFLVRNYPELGTLDMNAYLSKLLEPFVNACRFLENEHSCRVFLVPPSILTDPLNWPLISHEIAHVLELTQLHVVQKVHGPSPKSSDPQDAAMVKYRHSEEYQADLIAAILFGPSFVMRVLSIYFSQEIRLSTSHPAWEQRLKALLEVGLPRLRDGDVYKNLIGDSLKGISLEGGIVTHDVVNLPTVLDKTFEVIKDRLNQFDCQSLGLKAARERLGRFLPYTEDYKVLLNAAVLNESEAMSAYASSKLGPPERAAREYRYLVADCVRLCYVNMHYDRRIAIDGAAQEAQDELDG